MLSSQQITVSYNDRDSWNELNAVTAQFFPGQITAVVGPNGSGKSTLIRSLSRVLKPRIGTVLLDDNDLYLELTSKKSAQNISVVPQDTHVAFDFTARDVVAMGLSARRSGWSQFGSETDEDRLLVDKALQTVSLPEHISRRPIMTLSGGERQRALIARALVQDTPILLLDEPISSLDLRHQVALFQCLDELASRKHKTVVVVLHDLNVAATFAHRIIVLFEGEIVADGSPFETLTTDLIRVVYQVDVVVITDPVTSRPRISLIPPRSATDAGEPNA